MTKISEPVLPLPCSYFFKQHTQVLQTEVEGGLSVQGLALDSPAQDPQSRRQTGQALLGSQLFPGGSRHEQNLHQTPGSPPPSTWASHSTSLCLCFLTCDWEQLLDCCEDVISSPSALEWSSVESKV